MGFTLPELAIDRLAFIVVLLCALLLPSEGNAAPGDLDGSFGAGGKITGPAGGARSAAIQRDGAILVLSDNYPAASVLRYAADGSLDPSFGANGVASLPPPWLDDPNGGRQLLLQPDGKIVVAGYVDDGAAGAPDQHVRVARFTTAGVLDEGFGLHGIASFAALGVGSTTAAVIQADGRIAVAGYLPSGVPGTFVMRFTPDGSVDTTFAKNGAATVLLSNTFEPRSLLATSSGKLLLAGFDSSARSPRNLDVIARFAADGALDPSFGDNGIVSLLGNAQYALLQPDDRIVLVGFDVRRLNADGTPDPSFQVRCNPRPPSPPGSLCAGNGAGFAAIQPDGKIVLAGSGQDPALSDSSDFAVYRLNADGSDDASFGRNGAAFARFSGVDVPYDVALQSDGRIVLAGEAFGSGAHVAIARFLGDGATPASANFEGLWWASPPGSEAGWGINFAHQGDVIFATWFTYDASGKAWWLSMTAGKNADGSYSGALFQTRGPAFSATPFNAAAVVATQVGTATIAFNGAANGTFAYTVNGVTQSKAITRQVFGALPTCVFAAQPNLALATHYQDLWWNSPPGSESGWGINLTEEGGIIFGTWFTYDVDGAPLWLSVTATATSATSFGGTLYRTTGPAFNAQPFDPAKVAATAVGTATLSFSDGNAGTFAYTVNGTAQSKRITRQVFRSPGTVCH